MPQCFVDNFGGKITVIIDCFELYIDQPKNCTARNLTWSSYKHHHTSVIPSFTRGKKQLNPGDAEMTRRVANVQIHVERVIGSIKQKLSLLGRTLSIDFLPNKDESLTTLDQIVLMLCPSKPLFISCTISMNHVKRRHFK